MLVNFIKPKPKYLLMVGFFLLSLTACKRSAPMEPVKLNNEIVTLQDDIVIAFEAYTTAAIAKDEEQMELRRLALHKVAEENIKLANQYIVSTDNADFINAAKENFVFYQSITTDDLIKIERWYLADSVTIEQDDSLANVLRNINKKEDELDQRFKMEQKSFAEKNDFQLAQ